MARPCKDNVKRKVYSIRLTPEAFEMLSVTSDKLGISVSDLIQNYAIGICKWRIDCNYSPVFWDV